MSTTSKAGLNDAFSLALRTGDTRVVRCLLIDSWPTWSLSCVVHPLGFVTATCGVTDDGDELRVHLWTPGQREIQEPAWAIHNHSRSFSSIVLAGSSVQRRFEVCPGGERRLYRVEHDGAQCSYLRAHAPCASPKLLIEEVLGPGDAYVLRRDEYHSFTVTPGHFAATVVRTQGSRVSPSFVVGDFDGVDDYRFERVRVPKSMIEALVGQLKGS